MVWNVRKGRVREFWKHKTTLIANIVYEVFQGHQQNINWYSKDSESVSDFCDKITIFIKECLKQAVKKNPYCRNLIMIITIYIYISTDLFKTQHIKKSIARTE